MTRKALDRAGAAGHVAFEYHDDESILQVFADLIRRAQQAGAQAVCVLDSISPELLDHYLLQQAVDSSALFGDGTLSVRPARQVYFPDDRFFPDRVVQTYATSLHEALDRGFTGVWLAAETGWLADRAADWDAWVGYENQVNEVFTGDAAQAVCLYDQRRLPTELLEEIEQQHPEAVREDADRRARFTFEPAQDGWRLAGEIDSSNAGAFLRRLLVAANGTSSLQVEASGLEFVDPGTIRVLAEVGRRLSRLALVNPPPVVRRVIATLGIESIEITYSDS